MACLHFVLVCDANAPRSSGISKRYSKSGAMAKSQRSRWSSSSQTVPKWPSTLPKRSRCGSICYAHCQSHDCVFQALGQHSMFYHSQQPVASTANPFQVQQPPASRTTTEPAAVHHVYRVADPPASAASGVGDLNLAAPSSIAIGVVPNGPGAAVGDVGQQGTTYSPWQTTADPQTPVWH